MKITSIVPPIFLNALKFVFIWILRFPLRKHLKKNKEYKDLFYDKTVCVIGNGPSVSNSQDFIEGFEHVIVMNDFYRGSFANKIKPVAYCVGEPTSSEAWSDPAKIESKYEADSYWIDISNAKVHEEKTRKKFHYVNGLVPPNSMGYIGALEKSSLGHQTTAILAIQVAIYLGFKKITLIGFEHSWLATPSKLDHFYSNEKDEDDIIDRFTYDELMNKCLLMWSQYKTIRKFANKNGILIENATPNSFLDVFPKSHNKIDD